jgi:lipopolysaccharide export system permease protein
MLVGRLGWYLLREFLPLFLVGVLIMLVLLTLNLLAVYLAIFLNNRASLTLILQLLLDQLPQFLSLLLAPSLAFCILVGLGRVARDSELKAIFASGVRPIVLLVPILLIGVLVTGGSWVNENIWRPNADTHFLKTYYAIIHAEPPRIQALRSYANARGELFHAGSLAPRESSPNIADLFGVMIVTQTGIYTATKGLWDGNAKTWELYNVFFKPSSVQDGFQELPETMHIFQFTPPIEPDLRPSDQVSTNELMARASNSARSLSGVEVYDAKFKLQRRFADPLAALMMALVGGALGLTISNRAWGFAATIALMAAYWSLWQIGFNLAATQAIPAIFAAWLANAVFALGAIFGLRRLT